MSEPEKGTCSKCGQDVYVQTAKSGSKYYTNTTARGKVSRGQQNFHSDTCTGKKEEKPATPEPMERIQEPEDYHMEQQKQELKQESKEKSTENIEFKNADSLYKFGRTFKVIEVTLSKSCRVNKKTIAQLGDYEHKDYFISKKAEVEITNSFQQLAREQFAEMQTAIDKEITMDRLRLSGLDKTDDEIE